MYKKTVSLKLNTLAQHSQLFSALQKEFNAACNFIVPISKKHNCRNSVELHHLSYYQTRRTSNLGSQMVCNAIRAVSGAHKSLRFEADKRTVEFNKISSIHFDKRTYTLKDNTLSLYTLNGRVKVKIMTGKFQLDYLARGIPKEAELLCRKGTWYFNLVLDMPEVVRSKSKKLLGVDVGENNLAAVSSGKIFKGGKVRYERDKALSLRKRLQGNGSQSAKQLLKKISGKEFRRVKHINHEISKQIVEESVMGGIGIIVLEELTNIRKRIKVGKRLRIRLHRWPFAQLQTFIQYKAEAIGLQVVYVNPAYSSQLCSLCGSLGKRVKHRFKCSCGNQQHSDLNASLNLCRFALSADSATGDVNRPNVALS